MENINYTEYGYRGAEEVKKLSRENKILKQNVFDLQKQVQNAYKRNKELIETLEKHGIEWNNDSSGNIN